MENEKTYPTHALEIIRSNGSIFTDWGTFATDKEAIASALARKLAKGLRVHRIIRNGNVVFTA